uniref:Protein-arginine deiminase C-terminal domain-containing protein n=1 Tax=Malurus cyaneus samueli TaxID=2593467 RepID=A0A8C5U9Q3_9PASS
HRICSLGQIGVSPGTDAPIPGGNSGFVQALISPFRVGIRGFPGTDPLHSGWDFGVFPGGDAPQRFQPVLGPEQLSYGLAFPDRGFSGLVSFSARDSPGTRSFTDTVVFRMAPWIMTPNTQPPLEVFVCRWGTEFQGGIPDSGSHSQEGSVERCKRVPAAKGTPWDIPQGTPVQRGPHGTFHKGPQCKGDPVGSSLSDPSARGTPRGKSVSSLDSFGNLDVSPPVTVRGKEYPLGRILIGRPGSLPSCRVPRMSGRRMSKAVRDFLYAQQVQAPLELYSDWLSVGHLDEFLTFVPAPDRKVPALEPSQTHQKYPFPTQNLLFTPKSPFHPQIPFSSPKSPFPSPKKSPFPTVNMLVLGRHLGIPKPFGPAPGGRCCLEQRVRELLEPLGLSCTFIDDFFSYHVLAGDVHCGTNVRRQPLACKWWHVLP